MPTATLVRRAGLASAALLALASCSAVTGPQERIFRRRQRRRAAGEGLPRRRRGGRAERRHRRARGAGAGRHGGGRGGGRGLHPGRDLPVPREPRRGRGLPRLQPGAHRRRRRRAGGGAVHPGRPRHTTVARTDRPAAVPMLARGPLCAARPLRPPPVRDAGGAGGATRPVWRTRLPRLRAGPDARRRAAAGGPQCPRRVRPRRRAADGRCDHGAAGVGRPRSRNCAPWGWGTSTRARWAGGSRRRPCWRAAA